jgi:hypothetical protein
MPDARRCNSESMELTKINKLELDMLMHFTDMVSVDTFI